MKKNAKPFTIGVFMTLVLAITTGTVFANTDSGSTETPDSGKSRIGRRLFGENGEKTDFDWFTTDGKMPEDKLDEIKSKLQERIQNWDGTFPELPELSEKADGKGVRIMYGGIMRLDIASDVLGVSLEELKDKVQQPSGSNIFDLLTEAGKLEEYKQRVLAATKESLDKLVAEGKLEQSIADERYSSLEEMMANWDGSVPEPERLKDFGSRIKDGELPELPEGILPERFGGGRSNQNQSTPMTTKSAV